MSEDILQIILVVLGSSGFCELIRIVLGRWSSKSEIKKRLDKLEKDTVRTQLMTLMHDYPHRLDEIMEVAHHYFIDLKGNWFMTSLFTQWLKDNNIDKPDWFK